MEGSAEALILRFSSGYKNHFSRRISSGLKPFYSSDSSMADDTVVVDDFIDVGNMETSEEWNDGEIPEIQLCCRKTLPITEITIFRRANKQQPKVLVRPITDDFIDEENKVSPIE